jgi:hypothetical protein
MNLAPPLTLSAECLHAASTFLPRPHDFLRCLAH